MKLDISIVRKILIPLEKYPHISAGSPVNNAIALLLAHDSIDGKHLHFKEILITDRRGSLVGQLSVKSILENFFNPALSPSVSKHYLKGSKHFGDLILAIDDWFKTECKRQSLETVDQYMSQPTPSGSASAHVVHALGMMLNSQTKMLPVIDNNVLKGVVRMEDLFKVFGDCCFPPFPPVSTINRISTEGKSP